MSAAAVTCPHRCAACVTLEQRALCADLLAQLVVRPLRRCSGQRVAIARASHGVPVDLDLERASARRRRGDPVLLTLRGRHLVWGLAHGGPLYESGPRDVELEVRSVRQGMGGILAVLEAEAPRHRTLWPEQTTAGLYYLVVVAPEALALLPPIVPHPQWVCPSCRGFTYRSSVLFCDREQRRWRTCTSCQQAISDALFAESPARKEPVPDHLAVRVRGDAA